MNIYENIKKLCEIKGMSISGLESASHLSNGAISKWKTKMPQVNNLYSVSKALGTTIEHILTGQAEDTDINRNNSNFSEEDLELIENYKKLDTCEKQIVLGKISEFIYNKKMEESSEKLSSKVLWDLFADQNSKDSVNCKHND